MVLVYSFNKGHSVGYSLISVEEMYYKVYHPLEFWYCKIKYAVNEDEYSKFTHLAVQSGVVVFLPHVNYSGSKCKIRKMEGELYLQQGLSEIKGVGDKAAEAIVQERKRGGIFKSYDDFYDRCKKGPVNARVISILVEKGALEFNKPTYIKRVKKYNSALYGRRIEE